MQGMLPQDEFDRLSNAHQRLNTGERVPERELDELGRWSDRAQEALAREDINRQRRELLVGTFGPEKYEQIRNTKEAVGSAMEASLLYSHAQNPQTADKLLNQWSRFADKVETAPSYQGDRERKQERMEAILKFADVMIGPLEADEAREVAEELRKRYGNI